MKKVLSEEEMLYRLSAKCSLAEYCIYDIRQKLIRWEADSDVQNRIINYLIQEKYIDEERYAKAFIKEKMLYNRWGRRKIEQALMMKHVSKEIVVPLLDEMDDDKQKQILSSLLLSKSKTIKANNDYEFRCKLIRFALQRGFEMDLINNCLKEVNFENEF